MKIIIRITNRILVLLLMILILSCNNQSNKKYNMCVQVLKEHIKIVENCTDCEKLENYYYEIGKAGGWNHCYDFIELFSQNISDFDDEWYFQELNDNKQEKLQNLYDELKSAIDKKFISLDCTSEVIRAYISFYEELNAAITKCSDYKEYNSLVEDVNKCINIIYEDETRECYWLNHVSSFALHRLVKASKNITPEEDPIVTKIGQDYNNRIAPLVSELKAEEQYELLQKELFENSTLREKLHWLARDGAEKEWNELIDNNTVSFNEMERDYNNPVKANKKYKIGSDIILEIQAEKLTRGDNYSYVIYYDEIKNMVRIYTDDESFAERDYPRTMWIIAKYSNRYYDWLLDCYYYEFTDAELLAWEK